MSKNLYNAHVRTFYKGVISSVGTTYFHVYITATTELLEVSSTHNILEYKLAQTSLFTEGALDIGQG